MNQPTNHHDILDNSVRTFVNHDQTAMVWVWHGQAEIYIRARATDEWSLPVVCREQGDKNA